jgi:hypothetical protein
LVDQGRAESEDVRNVAQINIVGIGVGLIADAVIEDLEKVGPASSQSRNVI